MGANCCDDVSLPAPDDLTVAFRRQHVHAQRLGRITGIIFHVEGLNLCRVAMHHHRPVERLRDDRLVGAAKVTAILEVNVVFL